MNDWQFIGDTLPEDGLVVETKIDNEQGCRNEIKLKRQGRLWFFPDGSMYVYYTPTHWRTPSEGLLHPDTLAHAERGTMSELRTLHELIALLTKIADGLKKQPRDEFDRGAVTALESCVSAMKALK